VGRGRFAACLLAASFALLPAVARADDHGAQAEQLFERGRALFDAGRVDEACATLGESETLEPAVGTLGLLAACHERQGHAAAAFSEYLAAADLARARADDREAFARARAAAIAPSLAYLAIRVVEPVAGLTVTRDGVPIAPASLGREVVIDPGPISVAASAPEHRRFVTALAIAAGEHVTLEIPRLAPSPRAALVARASTRDAPAPSWLGPRRVLAIASAGVGLAGLGIGTAYGVSAIHHADASRVDCDSHDRCGPGGGALRDRARSEAMVSTLGFGVGLAGVAAAAALVLTEPRAPRTHVALAPSIGPRGGGASLFGRF
jgi:hypothetical protein